MMVDLGGEKGAIDEDEQEWIQNVFDFGDSSVRESMTPRSDMDALDIESTDGEILEMIQETAAAASPCTRRAWTPFWHFKRAGLPAGPQRRKNTALKDLLRPAYFVPETMKATTSLRRCRRRRCTSPWWWMNTAAPRASSPWRTCWRRLWATSTMSSTRPSSRRLCPWREPVAHRGLTPISTLVDDLELPLPESDDYDTLGGLIVTRLNAIPKDGEQFDMEIDGVALHIEKIEDHRIESVVATLLPKEEPEEK